MKNGNRSLGYAIKRRGCDKELFVEVTKGEKLSRQLLMTASFASSTVAEHSRDPSQYVKFGLREARINIDLGDHAAIDLEKPFLTGEFLRSSSTKERVEIDDTRSSQTSREMQAEASIAPKVSGKESASDNATSGEKSSVEQTITRSHIEYVSSEGRSELQWRFTAPENECLSGALQREPLCSVNLEHREDNYSATSQFEILDQDVVIHNFPTGFYEGLDKLDAQLKERRLKMMIAQKISEETCTEQELYRLLDKENRYGG